MKNKKYAFNTYLILFSFVNAVFVYLTVMTAIEKDWLLFGLSLAFSVIFFLINLIQPLLVTFTPEEIRIIYAVGVKEIISISKIRSIYSQGKAFARREGSPVYVVRYPHEQKYFFVVGEIPRTFRTKKLLKQYCGKKLIKE